MTSNTDDLDAIVVGAGWAGLGISYYLAQAGLRHRVLERCRIGETWRSQRWDAFRLNTPNWGSVMPGDEYGGPDPDGFMTRDEFVTLLEDFAARNRLPVETNIRVSGLSLDPERGAYRLTTPRGVLWARNVVIASGSLNHPRRPAVARALPSHLLQLDASDYRHAGALPPGAVLVVGSAQHSTWRERPVRRPDRRGSGAGRSHGLSCHRPGRAHAPSLPGPRHRVLASEQRPLRRPA
jgi:putative flavoprotein involved in K+ transport